MNSRAPLKTDDLQDLVSRLLERIEECTDEQLDRLSMSADQHLLDRAVKNGMYFPPTDCLYDNSYDNSMDKYDSLHEDGYFEDDK